MMKPNSKSIASDINQLMASDPLRFAQLMNSGLCLDIIDQPGQSGSVAQTSPSNPPFANYSSCSHINDRLISYTGDVWVPTTCQCRYDREQARQYALQWGSSDIYKDATPGMNVGAGTDCTNFASQVLAAGGFRPTEHWYYTRNSNGYIQTKSDSWAGANFLLSWLTGGYYGGAVTSDMTPFAQMIKIDNVHLNDLDSVVAAAQQANGLISLGDLVFYEYPTGLWDHVAVVIGWGSPYNFDTKHIAPNDRVPWIVDHGASNYSSEGGRIRPYNYQDPYEEMTGNVYFVHIPDHFYLNNVINAGVWHW